MQHSTNATRLGTVKVQARKERKANLPPTQNRSLDSPTRHRKARRNRQRLGVSCDPACRQEWIASRTYPLGCSPLRSCVYRLPIHPLSLILGHFLVRFASLCPCRSHQIHQGSLQCQSNAEKNRAGIVIIAASSACIGSCDSWVYAVQPAAARQPGSAP